MLPFYSGAFGRGSHRRERKMLVDSISYSLPIEIVGNPSIYIAFAVLV